VRNIPEQKSVPPIPGIIKASNMSAAYIPELNKFMLSDLSEKIQLKDRITRMIDARQQEALRLKRDIPRNADPNIIDAYNKGMLYKLESEIEDLKSLLSE
jgi:hypothetical protein